MKLTRLLLLSLVMLSCAVVTLATKGRSHPKVKGELSVTGLKEDATISRDDFGVPHIRAKSERDAFFALGVAHAQDRLFQMDLLRRFTYGKLSEWLGDDTVQVDLFMRGLDFEARAKKLITLSDPALAEVITAYCDGINEGAKSLKALPPEYRLLKVDFEPWSPHDSLAIVYLNSWNLASNPGAEMFAFLMRKKLNVASLDALVHWDKDAPSVDPYWDTLRSVEVGGFTRSSAAFLRYMGLPANPGASNNWVVGPTKSADGLPIVANDPHLSQQVPSLWYVADIEGGDFHAAGATFPGSPFVLTGHNETLAWGVTNTMADYVDFALVERSGDDGYILAGQPKKLKKVPLSIKVKDKANVSGDVYWTEIGPAITSLSGTHLLVLQWHAFLIDDQSGALFYGLNKAHTVDEAITAVNGKASVVSQNLVLGDTKGNFAWQVFGSVVKRRGFTGRVPYPASDPSYGWDFFTTLPGEKNPERGFIQTANSKPNSPDADAISTDYVPPWRYTRIGERLTEKEKLTADDLRAVQLDVKDKYAQGLLPTLLSKVSPSGAGSQCYTILKEWDYMASKSSIGNTVWVRFLGELTREALLDDLGDDGFAIFSRVIGDSNSIFDGLLAMYLPDQSKGVENALKATCAGLQKDLGSDTKNWQWGKVHELVLTHPFSDASKLLKDWNMPHGSLAGNDSTVSVAGTSRGKSTHETSFIPSIRVVTPLSDVSKATFVYPGGQSGQPESKHYSDLFSTYIEGKTAPLYFSDKDVSAKATEVLTLSPK